MPFLIWHIRQCLRRKSPSIGAKIAAPPDGKFAGYDIDAGQGKILLALLPVAIVDYWPGLAGEKHNIGDKGEHR